MSNRIDTTGLPDAEAYIAAFDAHPAMTQDWQRPACKKGWMDADTAKRNWIAAQGQKTLAEIYEASLANADTP